MSWEKALLTSTATIRDAIEVIDTSELQIGIVVDEGGHLIGSITDGDVRRSILKGMDISGSVQLIVNREAQTATKSDSNESLLELMEKRQIRQIPIIDEERRVIDIVHINTLIPSSNTHDNWVVLMAGGMGERLLPLTESTPKPLLPVGKKPLLETILESFIRQGFRKFYMSVNYKAEMIRDHFCDGSRWNVEIRYIEEKTRLGTAGALRLIQDRPDYPVIIMNGDLLTRVDFHHLLDFHRQHDSQATMGVRQYDFQVPFGVVELDGNRIKEINEKPVHNFFVNAGIYVLEPDLLDLIPENAHFDMTELFEKVIEMNCDTAVFPIREYWLDVGQIDNLVQANNDFEENFQE
jgi:dTDP-glucose pyrophosphorylase